MRYKLTPDLHRAWEGPTGQGLRKSRRSLAHRFWRSYGKIGIEGLGTYRKCVED